MISAAHEDSEDYQTGLMNICSSVECCVNDQRALIHTNTTGRVLVTSMLHLLANDRVYIKLRGTFYSNNAIKGGNMFEGRFIRAI